MSRIERETAQRILDAADIVEVVSDFVTLRRSGQDLVGLCPFHNDRRPSFHVSKSKGICKCFSCGKGGSPVNFIMEHEQLSYYEALRYLAKKYNIEIKDRELTDEERHQESQRESMLAINDFALKYYENILQNTADGKDIGLAYFRERGINDAMIKKFRLGYSLERNDDLYRTAKSKGFNEEYLIATGLCAKNDRGTVYDKFRGRVVYPIFSVSGRPIAFGARTLRSDKNIAKYLNSPESLIYHKSNELYGLYQAKQAIVKNDKCILVEGYMDVISMHQVGIGNVVASSGTSLTEGQIRLIHRFTNNVTVIYDSDAAGIKASLRGIDMLLREDLNVKVLLLPDGEDPDSFAQGHTSQEVEDYIRTHEKDFISFKTQILLKDAGNDPLRRSQVISDIVKSIAAIPNKITREVYQRECAIMLNFDEKVIALEVDKQVAKGVEDKYNKANAEKREEQIEPTAFESNQSLNQKWSLPVNQKLVRAERVLAKYLIKYGLMPLAETLDENGVGSPITVIEFIDSELTNDDLEWSDPVCKKIFDQCKEVLDNEWRLPLQEFISKLEKQQAEKFKLGIEDIRIKARNLSEIQMLERSLKDDLDKEYSAALEHFTCTYLENILLSSPDDEIRKISTDLASEKYILSKMHTKYTKVETELDRLRELVERGVLELKFTILETRIADLNAEIRANSSDSERVRKLMNDLFELYQIKAQFAKILGERIVNPR